MFFRALSIGKKVLGFHHPEVALDYYNIGKSIFDEGDIKQSLPYFIKAHSIFENVVDSGHKDAKRVIKQLKNIYEKMKISEPFDKWISKEMKNIPHDL